MKVKSRSRKIFRSRKSRSRKIFRSRKSRSRKILRSRKSRSRKMLRSRKSKQKRLDELSDMEFMLKQTVIGLKSYIKSKGISKGFSKLRKNELINFILKHIDVDTGELIN